LEQLERAGTEKQTAEVMIPQKRVVVLTRFDKASDFEFGTSILMHNLTDSIVLSVL